MPQVVFFGARQVADTAARKVPIFGKRGGKACYCGGTGPRSQQIGQEQ